MIIALGDRDLGYLTHREVNAALELFPNEAEARWVATDSPEARDLRRATAVWLLPGTPYRDVDAAFGAIRHCLETGVPFLGTCGGFQHAVVELARSRAGLAEASHEESDPDAVDPVISRLACALYGEVRTVTPRSGTHLAAIYGDDPFEGYHYCGYGVTPGVVARLEGAGVVVGATAPDVGVEAIEVPTHPFFLATAFQPQVGASEAESLDPLLATFVETALAS